MVCGTMAAHTQADDTLMVMVCGALVAGKENIQGKKPSCGLKNYQAYAPASAKLLQLAKRQELWGIMSVWWGI